MTTEPRPRDIRINLQASRANADAAIMEVIHMVSFGLSGTTADPGDLSGLPGAQMQFRWDGAPEPAETKEMFDSWIVGLGIRRYIEAANQFLDQAGVMASIVLNVPVHTRRRIASIRPMLSLPARGRRARSSCTPTTDLPTMVRSQ